ncbi:MAG: hypothetical protein ABI334_11160 [Candidatus Dormiibacterota bacterium]
MTEVAASKTATPTPRWLWWALLIGAAVLLGWAWFLFGFRHEPSAVGRVGLILTSWAAYSAFFGLVGLAAAIGLVRRAAWGRTLASISATGMTISVVGSVVGIAVLIGLYSSRIPSRN